LIDWLIERLTAYHSTDLLTERDVAHLVVHGTSGSTSYETIPPVRLETSGGVLSTVDQVQRRDGPRRLRDHDDDGSEQQACDVSSAAFKCGSFIRLSINFALS